ETAGASIFFVGGFCETAGATGSAEKELEIVGKIPVAVFVAAICDGEGQAVVAVVVRPHVVAEVLVGGAVGGGARADRRLPLEEPLDHVAVGGGADPHAVVREAAWDAEEESAVEVHTVLFLSGC